MQVYFGARWDAPALDDPTTIRQAPAPVGKPCMTCRTRVVDGDRGWIRAVLRDSAGEPDASLEPVHVECDLLGIIGHEYAVCSCHGYDTTSRTTALKLLDALNAERARAGMGPL